MDLCILVVRFACAATLILLAFRFLGKSSKNRLNCCKFLSLIGGAGPLQSGAPGSSINDELAKYSMEEGGAIEAQTLRFVLLSGQTYHLDSSPSLWR